MLDPKAHGGVDVIAIQLLKGHEGHLARFVAGCQLAADEPRSKAQRKLLADLAVVVGDDVPWVGVDAAQLSDLDVEAGLFLALPYNGVGDRLTRVNTAPRQR